MGPVVGLGGSHRQTLARSGRLQSYYGHMFMSCDPSRFYNLPKRIDRLDNSISDEGSFSDLDMIQENAERRVREK